MTNASDEQQMTSNVAIDTVTTIGLDIAKNVFQVHGVDAEDKVVMVAFHTPRMLSVID